MSVIYRQRHERFNVAEGISLELLFLYYKELVFHLQRACISTGKSLPFKESTDAAVSATAHIKELVPGNLQIHHANTFMQCIPPNIPHLYIVTCNGVYRGISIFYLCSNVRCGF